MTTGLLIDVPGVWLDAQATPTLCRQGQRWLQQLHGSGVMIITLRGEANYAGAGVPLQTVGSTESLPTLPALARWLHEQNIDHSRSWLVTADPQAVRLAATVGLVGAVLLDGPPPPSGVACTLARARDFADVPRVMIPPSGGCWHEHA